MTEETCCADFRRAAGMSRRRFMQGVAAASTGAVATTMFGDALRQTSFAATRDRNVLVVISLRGGIDGLGVVVPHGDPDYYRARPGIAFPGAARERLPFTAQAPPGITTQDRFPGSHRST